MNLEFKRPGKVSVEQYHEMIRAGTLTEEDSVELLEGELVVKMPKKPPHRIAGRKTRRALERVLPDDWNVDAQDPITLEESEPEPDISVTRAEVDEHADRHAGPEETALVVEVADSSLQRDRTLKKGIYARAKIPVYWIVNLSEQQLEVYTDPTGPADEPDYRKRQDYGPADQVPVVIEGVEVGRIAVADLLP